MMVPWRGVCLGLAVGSAAMLFTLAPFSLALEEDLGLAWLFHLRGPRQPPAEVTVVAIDGESAAALAQSAHPSQWPRVLHARLVRALAAAGARVISFDLYFVSPARDPNDDRALAAALKEAGNVVLLDLLEQQEGGRADLRIERRMPPIEPFAQAAAAHGPFPLPKQGLVHAYWTAKPGAGGTLTLPVLAFRIFDPGAARQTLVPRGSGDAEDVRYLDYYGPPRSVRTIAFHEVLAAADRGAQGQGWLRQTFGGRAVFVGYSAALPNEQDRIRDDYPTVFSRSDGLHLSGVEIAATAFANLVEARAPQPLRRPLHSGLLLGWGVLMGLLCMALRGSRAVVAVAVAGALYLALAHVRFVESAQWLPVVVPLLLQAPLALFGGAVWQHALERRERRRLGAMLQDLLPLAVVDNLLGRLRSVAPAERDVIGVFLYTDVQGFTWISEGMAPTQVARMLNDYFALIFRPVESHGGSVSDIVGDGMLAFWIASRPDADRRHAACLAAFEIAQLTSRADMLAGWPPLPTRIGVHGGPLILARVGASLHHEYRLVGDAVNTASRIEALSKHLGTRLLISAEMLDGLNELLLRPVGSFVLAGKSAAVDLCEPLARVVDATAEQHWLCGAFADALAAYRARRWADAASAWSAILARCPDDGPSRFYLQRARGHAAEPPPADWTGVERMGSK